MELTILECKHNETSKDDKMCELCGVIIKAGTPFSREVIKYDGVHYDRRLHDTCDAILEAFFQEQGTEDFRHEWVQKWLEEKYCTKCKLYGTCKIKNKATCLCISSLYERKGNVSKK